MRKGISVLMATFMALFCFACSNASGATPAKGGAVANGTMSDVTFWGAPATEKVLQDVHGIYDAIRTDAEISITAARGEYESSHIIMTAGSRGVEYEVKVNALHTAGGEEFAASGIDVFHEKYIEVTRNFESNGMPTGWYPDALVPVKNIKDAHENIVPAGKNQGLYFRFNVPLNQAPGLYTGTAEITIAGAVKTIPISLQVLDVEVSETSHAKNIFLSSWYLYRGELDMSQGIYDKYTETLFEYRLSPNKIVADTLHSDEDIEFYVDHAYTYMQNPKCTNITIPYDVETVNGEECFKLETQRKYLRKFAQKSFAENYNCFDKLLCYYSMIDEPVNQGLLERTKVVCAKHTEIINEIADEIATDPSIVSPIKDEVVASIRNLRNVVTAHWDAAYDGIIETWCPLFLYYNTEVQRSHYADQEEKWWYGCNDPRAPYPTYHIEDTLLSARAESWMKIDYGVVGNLYWGCDVYAARSNGAYVDIEDYYSGNAARYPNSNGEGFLFYPGKPYGIDGPIPSLRLEAIRDGLEEYELLLAMQEKYGTTSEAIDGFEFSMENALHSLTDRIYSGTKVGTTSEQFQTSRDGLLQLAMLSQNLNVSLVDFYDTGYGEMAYEFLAPSSVTVKSDGVALTPSQTYSADGGQYSKFEVRKQLSDTTNNLDLEFTQDGKSHLFVQALGGKATVVSAEQLSAANFAKESVDPTVDFVNGSSLDASITGTVAKIDLPATDYNVSQSFRMQGSVIEGMGDATRKIVLHIYYDGYDTPDFVVSAKHTKVATYYDLANVSLTHGLNEVTVLLTSRDWVRLGPIQYFAMYLGHKEGEPARTLWLIDSVIYNK